MLTSNSNKEDSMVAKASIIEIYAKADAAGRVDIICKNYSNFIGIVDGYTEGLRYMIESEKLITERKIMEIWEYGCRHRAFIVILRRIRQSVMSSPETRLLPVIFPEMYWKVLTVAKISEGCIHASQNEGRL